ncbi:MULTISPECIES: epoxide hydrolase family protein [unclassified Flavobacterium]|uniref:epoxide hydrolase family protein n=1 Tax=unclassified Flavobacterium TaxID=196869 RepID=UPI0012A83515|nr:MULTISPECIES: epoxide hydrolase [unclassified Flavobacterium]MBF4484856.1 alpha/beta fold hydrolase [Flavobacterium sp. CSZ]QGK73736.1 alpha/beta fold hydrolase [Flavobacterium sp. SLB02]
METILKNKNSFLTAIATGTFMLIAATGYPQKNQAKATNEAEAIRPYHISISKEALTDLRTRVNATRWPDKETVTDQSQGVKLQQIQGLVKYWGTTYDWRKTEAKLNALPQFVTNIDGLDIQFIHIKSKHKNALPLVITHGWPGSFFELLKVIGPLTDPTAYGGKAEDAFDLVIPSMPGYGFSEKPKGTGWGPEKIGNAWDVLMKRLGYKTYVSQGGDWGSVIADAMARQAPYGLLGIHVNMPATVPADIAKALKDGDPAPEGLSAKEKAAFLSLNKLYTRGGGYAGMMVTRPQTLGYGLTDSPVGLASFFLDKFNEWTYSGGNAEKSLTKDEMLDDITLYWLTNTANSSAQLYWENNTNNFNAVEQKTNDIKIPVAVTVFPGEIYQAPKSWTEKSYKNLIYFNEVSKGGHFASWEEPQLFTEELRAAFKSLRK